MRAPGFWSAEGRGWPALLLAPIGWIYGALTSRRMARPGWQAPVPVISIGNFTAGGAGKTPTVIAIQHLLRSWGRQPFVITRGYGGTMKGPLAVDPARHRADLVGDEAMLLAAGGPVIVAQDRVAGAKLALSLGADCLLLDDALQNPGLQKSLSIAVIDGGAGFGNGLCVPAGPLRAPLAAQLPHVSDLLLIGDDRFGVSNRLAGHARRHSTQIEPDSVVAAELTGRRVFAYSGIGRPEKFSETLAQCGAIIVGRRDFPDHHAFSEGEAAALLQEAHQLGADLVTTAKDHVRLGPTPALADLARASHILPITVPLPHALIAIIRGLFAD